MALRSLQTTTGLTLKTVIRDFSTGAERLWNTSGTPAFEAYNAANIANYGIATTEGSPGSYHWTVPAALPGSVSGYDSTTYNCAGASLATGDLGGAVWTDPLPWDGTQSTIPANVVKINSQAATATAPVNFDALSGLSGTGAYSISITVRDGLASPVPNANVRMTAGPISFSATTNSSGVASFSLDADTYVLAITKSGYGFPPESIVVDAGHTSFSKAISPIVIAPSADPGKTVGYIQVYDGQGNPAANVAHTFRAIAPAGVDVRGNQFTIQSNSGGLLAVEFIKGQKYAGKRSMGFEVEFTAPADADTFNLPPMIGLD